MAVITRREFRAIRRGPPRQALSLNVEAPRPKQKPRHEETSFHIEAWKFLRLILPADAVAFHVPNGGKRDAREAAVLKAMGVVAGIPDFVILWDRRGFCLELKSKDGVRSDQQRETIARLEDAGIPTETVRSFEEIRDRLEEFGLPLRRTVRFGNEWRAAA